MPLDVFTVRAAHLIAELAGARHVDDPVLGRRAVRLAAQELLRDLRLPRPRAADEHHRPARELLLHLPAGPLFF